jgi:drug/metabolite transporter (DMT)-like permease
MSQSSQLRKSLAQPGILAALGAALLFGAGTPIAKMLLRDVSPWLMAALLTSTPASDWLFIDSFNGRPRFSWQREIGPGLRAQSSWEVSSAPDFRCSD